MNAKQEIRLIEILLKMSELFEARIPDYRIYSMKHPQATKAIGYYNGRINLREDLFTTHKRRLEYTLLHEFAHHICRKREVHSINPSSYAIAIYDKTNQIDSHGPAFCKTLFKILCAHDKNLFRYFKTDYPGLMTPYVKKLLQTHEYKKFLKRHKK